MAGLLFLCAAIPAFAVPVECGWESEDSGVSCYRYQLNGEEEGKWTVVDGSSTGATIDMGIGLNILYVQASYDGVSWSESGHAAFALPREGEARASEKGTGRYEAAMMLGPYALQHIIYSEDYGNRTSRYGLGAGIGIAFNISKRFGIGTGLSCEWHGFGGFHDYGDIKMDISLRYALVSSEDKGQRLLLELGGGADLVIRDDGEIGFYPLLSYGIGWDAMLTDGISMNIGCGFGHTFQEGSTVFHMMPTVGITCHWGQR